MGRGLRVGKCMVRSSWRVEPQSTAHLEASCLSLSHKRGSVSAEETRRPRGCESQKAGVDGTPLLSTLMVVTSRKTLRPPD